MSRLRELKQLALTTRLNVNLPCENQRAALLDDVRRGRGRGLTFIQRGGNPDDLCKLLEKFCDHTLGSVYAAAALEIAIDKYLVSPQGKHLHGHSALAEYIVALQNELVDEAYSASVALGFVAAAAIDAAERNAKNLDHLLSAYLNGQKLLTTLSLDTELRSCAADASKAIPSLRTSIEKSLYLPLPPKFRNALIFNIYSIASPSLQILLDDRTSRVSQLLTLDPNDRQAVCSVAVMVFKEAMGTLGPLGFCISPDLGARFQMHPATKITIANYHKAYHMLADVRSNLKAFAGGLDLQSQMRLESLAELLRLLPGHEERLKLCPTRFCQLATHASIAITAAAHGQLAQDVQELRQQGQEERRLDKQELREEMIHQEERLLKTQECVRAAQDVLLHTQQKVALLMSTVASMQQAAAPQQAAFLPAPPGHPGIQVEDENIVMDFESPPRAPLANVNRRLGFDVATGSPGK